MSVALLAAALACVALGAAALEALAIALQRRPDPSPPRIPPPGGGARWARTQSSDPRIEALLDAAGRESGVASAAALRGREDVVAVVAAAWCGAVTLVATGPAIAAIVVPIAGIAGRRVPRALLEREARSRALRLREEAPEVVALVAAAAACGLPLAPMLATAGQWLPGALAAGFARAADDLHRGAAPELVLSRLEREHPVEEIAALVAIIRRGRSHGVAAAPALTALADGARASRARRAGDRAARAAPRIQLVAALLLVPAALCILAAAMLAGGLS